MVTAAGDPRERYRGCLLGLAAGDAVGTTLEFTARDSYEPLTDMVGGGPFRLAPGEWTDDTSMALCLAASLLYREGFDAADQMRRYVNWRDHGYMSSNGLCFDIGGTVSSALTRFELDGEPFAGSTDPRSAGNGSLMRLAPVVLFFHPARESALHHARESSRTTHGAAECLDACAIFAELLLRALDGAPKEQILAPVEGDFASFALADIASGGYRDKTREEIRGSGYVVHCLEAALWCFERAASFEEAILLAANLGEDADTTAAVCGQIAGAHHGLAGIPERWRRDLAKLPLLLALADALHDT